MQPFTGAGNGLANRIAGGGQADVLQGGDGNDTLDGGAGNDTYVVDDAGDVIVETGGGIDTVRTTLATFSLAAVTEVENLVNAGHQDFAGTGNALANRMTGGAGADTLAGGAGFDVFVAGEADGDAITDFAGDGALEGDSLLLLGFGSAAAGAQILRLNATDWLVSSGDGLAPAVIRLSNAASIHATDYAFG